MDEFKVFSANWEIRVKSRDSLDAALISLSKIISNRKSKNSNLSNNVCVINLKNEKLEIYPSVALLEDLNEYELAKGLNYILSWEKL